MWLVVWHRWLPHLRRKHAVYPLSEAGSMTCERCGYHTTEGREMALHLVGCLKEHPPNGLMDSLEELEARSEPLEPLAVLLEAELILMQHWAERRGLWVR